MSIRGKTTPASTPGSFSPATGRPSRTQPDQDSGRVTPFDITDTPLGTELADIRDTLANSRPSQIVSSFGTHSVEHWEDPDTGDQWATVSFMLATQHDTYVELESGTYGAVSALRVPNNMPAPGRPGFADNHQHTQGAQTRNELDRHIDRACDMIAAGDRPDHIDMMPVTHVSADDDEEGVGYSILHLRFPTGFHAVLDDGETYGEIQGIRIFHDTGTTQ